ncbi:hypothetical protein [Hymenobacter cellulosivorans]|uniref:Uncharacterized protein n=1 Tax=Hymenobacter cellulosivorans TaxID=2932249 RepID=A0ABY4FC40_9BACT|nr:hypothetical protein [Hymenobacter cellulosivorans]UOQ54233.1 hypothetical protein MUN80_05625 [Hymenobacter cellulosivorans]
MLYFHDTLIRYGFTQQRPGFYTRPNTSAALGGPMFCTTGEDERPRKMLLWQRGRILVQGDVVTLDALEQVLRRVLGAPTA